MIPTAAIIRFYAASSVLSERYAAPSQPGTEVLKQKEGKKRMKSIDKINIPQEAFIQVLKAQ